MPLIFAYNLIYSSNFSLKNTLKSKEIYAYLVPTIIYLVLRFSANSHWSGGDYSYDLLKLPLNFAGNLFGYFALGLSWNVFTSYVFNF